MHDDYIPQPRPVLCDECAAQVLDFLYKFIADFESAYYVELRRHWLANDHTERDPDRPWVRCGDDAPF